MKFPVAWVVAGVALQALGAEPTDLPTKSAAKESFEYSAERFADIQVLRYRADGFEALTLRQKKLAYFLTEAGLSGRDIFWDQKCRYNLAVRKTIEAVLETSTQPHAGADWEAFATYARQVFFSNGIHHHYASTKFKPGFSQAWFESAVRGCDPARLPLAGRSLDAFIAFLNPVLFDPTVAPKTVSLDAGIDTVVASSNNFYRDVTAAEVSAFYEEKARTSPNPRLSFGLNSQLVREGGRLVERPWRIGGMYGAALERVVMWLEKAADVAETPIQRESLEHLIAYYRTGDLAEFDAHCIAWVRDTESRVDAVNGFIEVYADAAGKKGAFESVVSFRDDEATRVIAAISAQAQWFEDHSPILDAHKKKAVRGISAKVITVVGESGDSAPATPVGINLPNAEWIREQHGSKSVSLGNIVHAYNVIAANSPELAEFAPSPEVAARLREFGPLASELHTDMHEVIGHASGQINPGVANPEQTLRQYMSTLEEARADLVALYYALDPKLVDMGVMPSLEVGRAEYDRYILNGLMLQLNRIEPGQDLQEAHMRNRQLNAAWAFAAGSRQNVIERFTRDGKTFFRVNDYERLRTLFGELLREIQRIKSEGDFESARTLVETYGVKVDPALCTEVRRRFAPLGIAPYKGFIQPRLAPVERGGEIVDVTVEYPDDFLAQMLDYGHRYGFLPVTN